MISICNVSWTSSRNLFSSCWSLFSLKANISEFSFSGGYKFIRNDATSAVVTHVTLRAKHTWIARPKLYWRILAEKNLHDSWKYRKLVRCKLRYFPHPSLQNENKPAPNEQSAWFISGPELVPGSNVFGIHRYFAVLTLLTF